MTKKPSGPQNSRQEREDADKKFLYLTIFGLVVVGNVAIALVYGPGAVLTALPCLGGGAFVIGGLWGMFRLLEKASERRDRID